MKKANIILAAAIIFLNGGAASIANAASIHNQLSNYAEIIGKASACGINTQVASRAVGRWLGNKASSGSIDLSKLLAKYINDVKTSAAKQLKNKSTCSSAISSFNSTAWP